MLHLDVIISNYICISGTKDVPRLETIIIRTRFQLACQCCFHQDDIIVIKL